MDYTALPLFNLMKTRLNYLSERQEVLARNVANADTPGYKAQDIAPPDFRKLLAAAAPSGSAARPMRMAQTQGGHMAATAAGGGAQPVIRPITDELNPSGNNVVIEEEMSRIATNQSQYVMTMNLYAKAIAMFKTAIGNPGGGG